MYLIYFDWDKVKNILKEEISSNITWTSMALKKRELDIVNNGQEVPQQKKNAFKNLHGKMLLIFNKVNVAALKSLKIWWNKERFKVLARYTKEHKIFLSTSEEGKLRLQIHDLYRRQ